jgi:hypothetical protein
MLTLMAKARIPKIDPSISRLVQPNYIGRPLWQAQPERDPVGELPTIGWHGSAHLKVPENLTPETRWAKAQGQHVDIAQHDDAETAGLRRPGNLDFPGLSRAWKRRFP